MRRKYTLWAADSNKHKFNTGDIVFVRDKNVSAKFIDVPLKLLDKLDPYVWVTVHGDIHEYWFDSYQISQRKIKV